MTTLRFLPLVLLTGLLLGPAHARAQRSSSYVRQFAGSSVLLTNGDTLQGPLVLHQTEDVILITMPDNTVSTLSAVAVQRFAVKGELAQHRQYDPYDFFDTRQGYYHGSPIYGPGRQPLFRRDDANMMRVFRVYRWNHDNDYSDYRSPAFFEQLSNGPQVLLRREILVQRVVSPAGGYSYGAPGNMGTYTDIQDKFYLGSPAGSVVALRNPKKDLLAIFRAQAKQLEKYAKENKLSFTEPRDLAYIVNYANSLQTPK